MHCTVRFWNTFSPSNICYYDFRHLDCGQHVSAISSRATKTFGFLRQNLSLVSRETKESAYKTLMRPKMEYAAPVWNPYTQNCDRLNRDEKRIAVIGFVGVGETRIMCARCWMNCDGEIWKRGGSRLLWHSFTKSIQAPLALMDQNTHASVA